MRQSVCNSQAAVYISVILAVTIWRTCTYSSVHIAWKSKNTSASTLEWQMYQISDYLYLAGWELEAAHASLCCSCTHHMSHIRQQHQRQLALRSCRHWFSLIITTRLRSYGDLWHVLLLRKRLKYNLSALSWQKDDLFSSCALHFLRGLRGIMAVSWC